MKYSKAVKINWDEIPKEKLNDLLERRIISGEKAMIAHVYLKKGCIIPLHVHENEQLTYILEGKIRFWLGEDKKDIYILKAGDVLVIPGNTPHQAEAVEYTLDVDIFSPPREDWLNKTDDYLKGNK